MQLPKCPHCGESRLESLFPNQDYLSGEVFNIVGCSQCELAWTDVPQHQFNAEDYYPKEYYGETNRRFHPMIESLINNTRAHRARLIQRYAKTPGTILDMGCGRGLMLNYLKQRGWECWGTEHSEQSSQHAREVLGLPVKVIHELENCGFEDQSFDVVTLWHVFEHVTDPKKTLEEIDRILKPGGTLFLEVPNFSSWQAKIGNGKWFHLDAPRHLYHFSDGALTRLLNEQSFDILDRGTWSSEFGPFGMIQTLLNLAYPEPNALFSLMKNKAGSHTKWSRKAKVKHLLNHALLTLPYAGLGSVLELAATSVGQGGVFRVIARKRG